MAISLVADAKQGVEMWVLAGATAVAIWAYVFSKIRCYGNVAFIRVFLKSHIAGFIASTTILLILSSLAAQAKPRLLAFRDCLQLGLEQLPLGMIFVSALCGLIVGLKKTVGCKTLSPPKNTESQSASQD